MSWQAALKVRILLQQKVFQVRARILPCRRCGKVEWRRCKTLTHTNKSCKFAGEMVESSLCQSCRAKEFAGTYCPSSFGFDSRLGYLSDDFGSFDNAVRLLEGD